MRRINYAFASVSLALNNIFPSFTIPYGKSETQGRNFLWEQFASPIVCPFRGLICHLRSVRLRQSVFVVSSNALFSRTGRDMCMDSSCGGIISPRLLLPKITLPKRAVSPVSWPSISSWRWVGSAINAYEWP